MKKVVRIPGERAKVAVESYDDRIDPIGACIGVKGSRIMGIVRELRNENIDVIQWTANTQLMITRALNPARISRIDLGEGPEDKIKVYREERPRPRAGRHRQPRRPGGRDRGRGLLHPEVRIRGRIN